jgi:Mrp family chromosome partitioning ATPase
LKARHADSTSAQAEPPQDLPVWVRIPNLLPREITRSIWQKPIAGTAELDLSPHLRALLDRISDVPGHRGKVALVTSVEKGVGSSTVARSLNLSAVNGGMLSVLIQVQSDLVRAVPVEKSAPSRLGASKASLRSVNVLLSASRNVNPPATDDIRSEFDLIVVDAPSLAEQPDVASLSAHADLVILVVRDGAADPVAIRRARAALSKFGVTPTGIVLNRVPASSAPPQPQSEMLGLAS